MRVPVEVEYPLYIPEYLMRMKAKERVAYLMAKQQPKPGMQITTGQLAQMAPNDKPQGAVVVPPRPGEQRDVLIIPACGAVTVDELRYLVGMVKEGGYGHAPYHHSKDISKNQWKTIVGNFIDKLYQVSQSNKTGRVVFAR